MTSPNTINVSPTRMEKLRQTQKLQTAQRAHKLLNDKYDEMVRTFTELNKQNQTLRNRVEKDLTTALQLFLVATTKMSPQAIDTAIQQTQRPTAFNCGTRNIMGLIVPHIEIATPTTTKHLLITTPPQFDDAINLLQQLTATIINLANLEKTCSMLADEIQKVRRRINSLEYKMIPNIQHNIKFITMKLDENQRETQIRVMKIKDLQTSSN